MKITNYQKQSLKMWEIKFTNETTFEEAQALIEKAEAEHKNLSSAQVNNLDGSIFFSRWNDEE
jgi:ATP-dependent Clp protease ATP-binding subunit ClpA